jgi:adenylate kinase family enzyme
VQRVMVIGSPGAGKSTFARAIAERLGLPLIHLDAEYWQAGWVEPPAGQWRARVAELVAGEQWMIDGNYGGSMDLRLTRADTVVWLDYPTRVCLTRALRRIWRYRGQTRPDMAEGCPESFNWGFLHYIATFRRAKRPGIVRGLARFAGEVVQLRTPRDAERWLGAMAPRG